MARLGAGRDGYLGSPALDGGYLDGAPERRGRDRNRHPAMDVGTVALKDRVWGHGYENVEIAGGGTAHPNLAFAGEADADAVLDPRGNVDREGLLAPDSALAGAGPAWLFNHPPGALARGAGLLDREKPLLHSQAAPALTSRAGDRLRAGFGAAAVALVAGNQIGDADRRLLAAETLFERNFEIVSQVAA